MFGARKVLHSLVHAVLSLTDTADKLKGQLNRMELILSNQSDALAAIVASLTTNFGNLDAAIATVVAAAGAGTPDPALQASIDALGKLNTAVQADVTKLAPTAAPVVAAATAADATSAAATAAPAPGKMG
jgi:hypothetical protein